MFATASVLPALVNSRVTSHPISGMHLLVQMREMVGTIRPEDRTLRAGIRFSSFWASPERPWRL